MLPHALTPIEDQLRLGDHEQALQRLYDGLHSNQLFLADLLARPGDPAMHRLGRRMDGACEAAERLIVEIWLQYNPGQAR